MKSLIRLLPIVAILFVVTACGSKSDYNPEQCTQLQEKIEKKDTLTQPEVSDLIDQFVACAKDIRKATEAAKDDPEKIEKLSKDKAHLAQLKYFVRFSLYCKTHFKSLSPENQKKFNEAEKEVKSWRVKK